MQERGPALAGTFSCSVQSWVDKLAGHPCAAPAPCQGNDPAPHLCCLAAPQQRFSMGNAQGRAKQTAGIHSPWSQMQPSCLRTENIEALGIAAHPCPLVGQIIPAVDDRRDPQQSLQVSAVLGGSCGSHCVARVVLASLLPFTGLLHRSAEHPGIVAMQENS